MEVRKLRLITYDLIGSCLPVVSHPKSLPNPSRVRRRPVITALTTTKGGLISSMGNDYLTSNESQLIDFSEILVSRALENEQRIIGRICPCLIFSRVATKNFRMNYVANYNSPENFPTMSKEVRRIINHICARCAT